MGVVALWWDPIRSLPGARSCCCRRRRLLPCCWGGGGGGPRRRAAARGYVRSERGATFTNCLSNCKFDLVYAEKRHDVAGTEAIMDLLGEAWPFPCAAHLFPFVAHLAPTCSKTK